MMRRGLSLWLIILLLAVPLEAATAGQCVRTNVDEWTWQDDEGWESSYRTDGTITVWDPMFGFYDESWQGGTVRHIFLDTGEFFGGSDSGALGDQHTDFFNDYWVNGNAAHSCP